MLRNLYAWTMALAARKAAAWWLAIIAFVESSFFLVPADVLFLPMVLAMPKRAYWYATIATVASVLGGILGWAIGHYAFQAIAEPVLAFYGKLDTFNELSKSIDYKTILLLLVTSGHGASAPFKVVTILSGVANFDLTLFILSAIVARGARFFALAFLLNRYGEEISHFIEKRLGFITMIAAAVVIVGYAAYKLLH